MFVGVARLTLQIADSGSLKSKRQVLRRVTDRLKARFNVSVAEVEDQDLWQRATIALAVVSADRRHVDEQIQKIIHFVEEMYVAPLLSRELEILAFGDQLFGGGSPPDDGSTLELPFAREDRSLAEAEGMADWDRRPGPLVQGRPGSRGGGDLTLTEARARAKKLRNKRDWEKP
jgi:uncharacterized protein YlxP (DUF503 family)